MPQVTDFMEYREYLRAVYEERKSAQQFFSYRFMAGKIGVDPGYLVKVLQGKRHLSDYSVDYAANLCGLVGQEREYFLELVRFAKAKGEASIKAGFDRLMTLKGVATNKLDAQYAAFWSDWRHHAIRSLLGIVRCKEDYDALGAMLAPPISGKEARDSVEFLADLGMARRGPDGFWQIVDRFVSAGRQVPSGSLKPFLLDTLRLAGESLEGHPSSMRSLSTLTVALSRDKFEALRDRMREFRQEILRIAQSEESADTVYQLNMQLFPIAVAPQNEP